MSGECCVCGASTPYTDDDGYMAMKAAVNAELDDAYLTAASAMVECGRLREAVAMVRAYLDDNAHMMRPEDVRELMDLADEDVIHG